MAAEDDGVVGEILRAVTVAGVRSEQGSHDPGSSSQC